MKNIYLRVFVLLFCAGAFLTSCSDYLNILPKGKKIPETLADYEALLRNESNVHINNLVFGNLLLNDYYYANLSYYQTYIANFNWDESINRIAVDDGNSTTSPYYNLYASIAVCNLILQDVPGCTGATAAEKAEVIAYARVLRAIKYFTLVNYYAATYEASTAADTRGVPFITSAAAGASYPQISVQALYDFMISEVQGVIDDGSLPANSMTILHPNLGAGYAFLARVYLQMGEYGKALANAELALAQNSALFDWREFYETNKGVIENGNPDSYATSPMGFDYVENYYFCHGRGNVSAGNNTPMPESRGDGFETGDARFASSYKLYTVDATYYKGKLTGFFNYGGLTTVEVYLIKAECLARGGHYDESMDVLNTVRKKRIFDADYTPRTATTEAECIGYIRQTKANELIFNIMPFADARRYNIAGSPYRRTLSKEINGVTVTLSPDSHLWIFPFPIAAANNTSGGVIIQNVEK